MIDGANSALSLPVYSLGSVVAEGVLSVAKQTFPQRFIATRTSTNWIETGIAVLAARVETFKRQRHFRKNQIILRAVGMFFLDATFPCELTLAR